jgi:hypothetical protein
VSRVIRAVSDWCRFKTKCQASWQGTSKSYQMWLVLSVRPITDLATCGGWVVWLVRQEWVNASRLPRLKRKIMARERLSHALIPMPISNSQAS